MRAEAIAAVNDGRVPPELQEELTAAVNLLSEDVALEAPAPSTTTGETDTGGEEEDD